MHRYYEEAIIQWVYLIFNFSAHSCISGGTGGKIFFKGNSRWIPGELPFLYYFCTALLQKSHSQSNSSIIKLRMGEITVYEGFQRREWRIPCFRDAEYIILSDSQFRGINKRDLERLRVLNKVFVSSLFQLMVKKLLNDSRLPISLMNHSKLILFFLHHF